MSYTLQDSVKILQSVKKMNDQYKLLKYKAFFFFLKINQLMKAQLKLTHSQAIWFREKYLSLLKCVFSLVS